MVGVESLEDAYYALGLPLKKVAVIPTESINIEHKITNPPILEEMGINKELIKACGHIERAANYLDSFSETGHEEFLQIAQQEYEKCLALVPQDIGDGIKLVTASAMSYFHLEQYMATRIKRGNQFSMNEILHYHYSRGADSNVYAAIAATSYDNPGLVAGFRHRQALWDISDDIEDLQHDIETIGTNMLLMMDERNRYKNITKMASGIQKQTVSLDLPPALSKSIDHEYEKLMVMSEELH